MFKSALKSILQKICTYQNNSLTLQLGFNILACFFYFHETPF